jgi:hypothetical protein
MYRLRRTFSAKRPSRPRGALPCPDCEGCAVASYLREYSIVIIFISFFPPGGVPYISKVW